MALSIIALAIALVSAAGVIYSVVIGRQALAWQKAQDLARVTPALHVEIGHSTEQRRQFVINLEDTRPFPIFYMLTVSVINTGRRRSI